jgi:hypothetical protein
MQTIGRSYPVALVLAALAIVLIALAMARRESAPAAPVPLSHSVERALVDRAAANVAAARRRYQPRRWDRAYALAWALHRHRQLCEMQRSDAGRAWAPLETDAEGLEVGALVQEARSLAQTSREKSLTQLLEAQVLGPLHPGPDD